MNRVDIWRNSTLFRTFKSQSPQQESGRSRLWSPEQWNHWVWSGNEWEASLGRRQTSPSWCDSSEQQSDCPEPEERGNMLIGLVALLQLCINFKQPKCLHIRHSWDHPTAGWRRWPSGMRRWSEVLWQAVVKVNIWWITEGWKERKARTLNHKSKLKVPTRNRTEEKWRKHPER